MGWVGAERKDGKCRAAGLSFKKRVVLIAFSKLLSPFRTAALGRRLKPTVCVLCLVLSQFWDSSETSQGPLLWQRGTSYLRVWPSYFKELDDADLTPLMSHETLLAILTPSSSLHLIHLTGFLWVWNRKTQICMHTNSWEKIWGTNKK